MESGLNTVRRQPLSVRALGVLLALATIGAQFAIPYLDSELEAMTAVVESEHAPGECASLHDHAACLRLGASPWGSAAVASGLSLPPLVDEARAELDAPAVGPGWSIALNARGPPASI